MDIRLIEIGRDGTPAESLVLPEVARPVCQTTAEHYQRVGFVRPWTGFLAMGGDGQLIGTCGFKGPPQWHRVEIAYFTFAVYEGRGISTEMARQLIQIARDADPTIDITAHTLPEYGASTSILRKLGFQQIGLVFDPEDGDVWEWKLKQPLAR